MDIQLAVEAQNYKDVTPNSEDIFLTTSCAKLLDCMFWECFKIFGSLTQASSSFI